MRVVIVDALVVGVVVTMSAYVLTTLENIGHRSGSWNRTSMLFGHSLKGITVVSHPYGKHIGNKIDTNNDIERHRHGDNIFDKVGDNRKTWRKFTKLQRH